MEMDEPPSFLQSLSPRLRDSLLRPYINGQAAQAAQPGSRAGQRRKAKVGQAALASPLTSIKEFARVSVRAERVALDNATLRSAVAQLEQQNKALESQIQALVSSSHRQQARAEEDAAFKVALLEDQVEQQKAALRDLACKAQALAKENVALGSQVERLRSNQEDGSRERAAMQARLSHLQSTCLALGAPCGDSPCSASALVPAHLAAAGGGLLGQVTAALAVLSPEQPGQQPLEPSRAKAVAEGLPTDLRLALREVAALRRDRDTLQAKVKQLSGKLEKLKAELREVQQGRAAERRAANAAAAQLQLQLETAKRKIEHLAGQVENKNELLAERGTYICKLEQTLISHRGRQPQARGAVAAATRPAPDLAAITPHSKAGEAAAAAAAATATGQLEGVAYSPLEGVDDWLSYNIGSPGSTARKRSPSVRPRPGSAPSRGRPRSPRGRSLEGVGSPNGDPVAVKLAAVLEALEMEHKGAGLGTLQPQQQQQQQPLQEHRRQAAPNNPLFSLSEAAEAGPASPEHHGAYQLVPVGCVPSSLAGEGEEEGSPGGWAVGMSPGNVAASLTFLHRNSLFQDSPMADTSGPSPLGRGSQRSRGSRGTFSPGLASPRSTSPTGRASVGSGGLRGPGTRVQGGSRQLIEAYRGQPGGQGQGTDDGDASRQGRSTLLTPSDDEEMPWGPALPGAAADAEPSLDKGQLHVTKGPSSGAGAGVAESSMIPGRCTTAVLAQQAQQRQRGATAPGRLGARGPVAQPAQAKPGCAEVEHRAAAAGGPSNATAGRRGSQEAHGAAGLDSGLGSDPRDPLDGIPELPEDGFVSVTDLLEALTPKSAAAVAAEAELYGSGNPAPGRAGGAAEGPGRQAAAGQQQGRTSRVTGTQQRQQGPHGLELRQGVGSTVQSNRHTLHRAGSSPGGAKLQVLKQGRLNRAADQMTSALPSHQASYASAAARRQKAGAGAKFTPARV